MMTDNKTPQRKPAGGRNSTSQKILSAGLATAACLGVTGVVALRTVQANEAAAAEAATAAPSADAQVSTTAMQDPQIAAAWAEISQYAKYLDSERASLDAYRADLVKTAKKLNKQIDQLQASTNGTSSSVSVVPAVNKPKTTQQQSKPKTKNPAVSAPQVQAQPQPQQQAPKAPAAAPAPKPAAPPAAAKPQANTKSS